MKPEDAADALHVHVDGACRGNPGEAGFGLYVTTESGAEIASLYGYLGQATNNIAEYQGLIHGLKFALARGARKVRLFMDSELVVRQMQGAYKVRHPGLIPLQREALGLFRRIEEASLTHVRREANRRADRLANRALDEKASRLS